jgi:hypothetical protein
MVEQAMRMAVMLLRTVEAAVVLVVQGNLQLMASLQAVLVALVLLTHSRARQRVKT